MTRKHRIAPGSGHDSDWQAAEYRRLMGKEAAERQEHAAKVERGDCVCRRFTVKTPGSYRTIHRRECVKYKPWMLEYLESRHGVAYQHSPEREDTQEVVYRRRSGKTST